MLPSYSCTEYISPSGSMQIYIVRKQGTRSLQKVSERKRYIVRQKCLGMALIVMGFIGCLVFPEDCGGGLLAIVMGLARVISNR